MTTEAAAKWLTGREHRSVELLGKGRVHVLGRAEWDDLLFHHGYQNCS